MPTPRLGLALLAMLPLACGDAATMLSGGPPARSAIVNGERQPEAVELGAAQRLAIGAVLTLDGSGDWMNTCTGTLIAPDVVLTAAHCFQDEDGYVTPASDVAFAIGEDAANPVASALVSRLHVHPDYDDADGTAENDLAILLLAEPLRAATPLPLQCDALSRARFVGQTVQNVGFGDTSSRGSSNTRKWWATQDVVGLSAFDFTVDGYGEAGVCTGDSGGPSLWTVDGRVRIVGVLSWGDAECGYQDHFARVDAHCDFIRPFITVSAAMPVASDSCVVEGVAFEGEDLERARTFLRTMSCESCDAVLDARTCEDAINDASACQVGPECTGCSDGDTREDGVGCAELSGYAAFGPSAAQALLAHVRAGGSAPSTGTAQTVEGVTFSPEEAAAVLEVANSASLQELDEDVGLDARAARGIVEGRPFASLEALAVVPYVGSAALQAMVEYVR